MIVPPGFMRPSCSATSNIFSAMRSFMELPGLKNSTLANMVAGMSLVMLLSLTSGVLPMVCKMLL